jgi:hypothetical protein
MVVWGDLKYVGIVLLPPSLWCFALEYAGWIQRMNRWWVAALSIEPALVLAALAVPSTHDLVRSLPASAMPGTLPVADAGPLFWVHLVYSYLLLVRRAGGAHQQRAAGVEPVPVAGQHAGAVGTAAVRAERRPQPQGARLRPVRPDADRLQHHRPWCSCGASSGSG